MGRKLLTVREIMHTGDEMPLLLGSSPMSEVLCAMTGKGFGVTGVLEENELVGIITDGDLRRHMGPGVMTREPIVVPESALVVAALRLMQKNRITSLFVTRDEKPLGILNVHDCLRAGVE